MAVMALEATMTVGERLTTTEATAALITALVDQRKRLTTAQAADMVGMSRSATYRLLCRAARKAPITIVRGWWQRT